MAAATRSKGTARKVRASAEDYEVEAQWTPADRARLADLLEREKLLPADAPRVLLSVRLSVFTDETTSPVRQELDLREGALQRGYRVVGLASDLNVSATKIAPWKRKSLGDWLNNRVPEFDVLMFWKIDRFIRNLQDLMQMIKWCQDYNKILVSLNDSYIDLSTDEGKMMVILMGGIAAIEARNTKTRVTSLWQYTKTQDEWHTGKPPFGYRVDVDANGKKRLVHDEHEVMVIRDAYSRLMAGEFSAALVREYKERECGHKDCPKGEKWISSGTNAWSFNRRLRNPAIMGYRVERDVTTKDRSRIVIGPLGQPLQIAEPILSEQEYKALHDKLEERAAKYPNGQQSRSRFVGVLFCEECGEQLYCTIANKGEYGTYAYLRCKGCKGGGPGLHAQGVYDLIEQTILTNYGDVLVQYREYARGKEARAKIEYLEDQIAYYMEGLAPGGNFTRTEFTRGRAQESLDAMIAELEAIDPSTAEDRWVHVSDGRTFRQHWEDGGIEAMEEDLARVGVEVHVKRTKIPGKRQPEVALRMVLPEDLGNLLVVKRDEFANELK